jgi:ABC-2 type transport system ATP-binding protein
MVAAIEARGLVKVYGDTRALDGLDLEVETGTILGVLGPNGAGKTTAVRVLTTLTEPNEGWARVAGYDVVADAPEVRRHIGLTGQYASVDESLTGVQNLVMIGELTRMPRRHARARAAELLEQFSLTHAGGRPVKTYSGGMRRRLDLAASLIGDPEILFLDEPTTGLDPTSRLRMWDVIRSLVDGGTTLLLTTQYLEEADQLAHRIVVVDGGRVIAEGTSDELKAKVGGELLDVTLSADSSIVVAERILTRFAVGPLHVDADNRQLAVPLRQDEAGLVTTVVGALAAEGVRVDSLDVRRPSLDDVFMELTGHVAEPEMTDDDEEEAA